MHGVMVDACGDAEIVGVATQQWFSIEERQKLIAANL
jgi:hypothetical protein